MEKKKTETKRFYQLDFTSRVPDCELRPEQAQLIGQGQVRTSEKYQKARKWQKVMVLGRE